MTRQQRKDALKKSGMGKDIPARPYSAVRAVACRQAGLDYRAVSLPSPANAWKTGFPNASAANAQETWEMTQPDTLGRLIPDGSPFPGQKRANGRPL